MKALIANDTPALLRIYERRVARSIRNVEILKARTVEEAIEYIRNNSGKIELGLIDHNFRADGQICYPESGIRIIDEWRALEIRRDVATKAHIVLVTQSFEQEILDKAINAGANDALSMSSLNVDASDKRLDEIIARFEPPSENAS